MEYDRRTDPSPMNAEQLAGQMVAAGFPGTEPSPGILELIAQRNLGGVIYFSRNISSAAQLRDLSARLQEAAASSPLGLPLLISIDQEGGTVARLTESEGGTVFAGNMLLGAAGSADLAYIAARHAADELRAVGVNWDYAPVLDVLNNPANPVISVRSYGEDPHLVARLGAAAVRGYQDGGVLATAKHFPGHGDTDKDSHLLLPTIPHDRSRLDEVELVPFRAAIAAGVGSIMTAHITFPAIEGRPGRPATLSRAVLTGLLRNELGFGGLIVTDCMEMKAITDNFGSGPAAREAVKAGADMVLVSHTFERQAASIDAIAAGIRSGEIRREQAEESVRRILQAKASYAARTVPAVTNAVSAEHRRLADDIAAAGVTLVSNDRGLVPAGERVRSPLVIACRPAVISPVESKHISPAFPNPLLDEVRRFRPEATGLAVGLNPTTAEQAQVFAQAGQADLIIFATTEARVHPEQAALVSAIHRAGHPLIAVATRSPFDAGAVQAGAFLAAYEYRLAAMRATAEIIFGARRAAGRLPVSLPGLYPAGHPVGN